MLSVDSRNIQASLQQYKEILEKKLQDVAQAVSYRVAQECIDATPYGDTLRYSDWYKRRNKEKGYRIEPGLAKGSWVLSLNNQVSKGAVFYDTSLGTDAKSAAMSTLQSIKLGDIVIINNSLDYIPNLEDGDSPQAPYGIRKPALEQIKSVYKIDIQRVLSEH